jgi:hypothetical protein
MLDAFVDFEDARRWLAWRAIERNGKLTKTPCGPDGNPIDGTAPANWLTRLEAEGAVRELEALGLTAGLGIALGDLGDDTWLAGADLDSSIRAGTLDRWAAQILVALQSYAEVSPSGNGLKAFFCVAGHMVRPFLDRLGVAPGAWGTRRGIPGLNGGNHGPAIEIYCAHRFFTVTGRLWSVDHPRIVLVNSLQLAELTKLIPKRSASAGEYVGGTREGLDNSRSGKAWRAALALAAKSIEEMCKGLREHPDPEVKEWANEVDDRQLERLWDRGAGNPAAREEALALGLSELDARLPPPGEAACELCEPGTDDSGGAPIPPAVRPIVQIAAGQLPAVIDAAEAILVETDRDLYEFGDQVVRPARAPITIADKRTTVGLRLVPVRLYHMIERFTRCIDFRKFNKKEKQWLPVDCPEAVARMYLERVGKWRLPRLTALTSCPLLLADGRIVEWPGFDAASGILFDPQGTAFPGVPPKPSLDDARRALDELKSLFAEFPFVDGSATSVLLSALLTSVSRLAYDFAPLHGFDAPVAGTGKSKLVDCCSVLVSGHECPVISQGDDETEFEKRLGAELLEGRRIVSVDNCEKPLGGPLLCQTATQHFILVRVLGFSRSVLIVNSALVFATGNNLKLYGDMLRRGLNCRLDAGEERPELRSFKQEDPVRVLKRDRGRYAVAALTMLRAYILAGRPIKQQPLGGFEGWSDLVRNTLLWLGEADPVETIESARAEDPERQQLEAVIAQWHAVLGNGAITTRDVINQACQLRSEPTADNPDRKVPVHPEFRNALLDVAGERGRISPRALGKWIGANKHKVAGKYRLAAATMRTGNARWRLQQRNEEGRWTHGGEVD